MNLDGWMEFSSLSVSLSCVCKNSCCCSQVFELLSTYAIISSKLKKEEEEWKLHFWEMDEDKRCKFYKYSIL